jgi:formylglycine-generating enzyme required for sulfatase activity
VSKLKSPAWNLAAIWLVSSVTIGCSEMARQETMAPGEIFKDCPDCPQMVVVPEGNFTMGSPIDEQGRRPLEGPQHEVKIDRQFAIGKYEVTLGEFRQFVVETDRYDLSDCWELEPASDQHPVVCVDWQDASDYAQWMAEKTGKPYRLPTEAEWEYAARAGTTTSRHWGDGDAACKLAAVSRCGLGASASVGQYPANSVGLHDMMGNVWEWVEDCWNDSYVGAPVDGSAWVTGKCDERVLRGGSVFNKSRILRSAGRNWNTTDFNYGDIGIRLARSMP